MLYPEPVLVGRSEERLRAIAERHGLTRWTTSLDEVLGDPEIDVYFDTQVTSAREDAVARAIAAGKHVYTEKPVAASAAAAFALAEAARAAGITHGVVQDKLFLPGMIKLRRLIREGFFGRVLSVRVEFGYWVFEGDGDPGAAPVMELPRGGRRRHRARHVPALAVPARGPVRPGQRGVRAARHPPAQALGRGGRAVRGDRRRRRLRGARVRRRRRRAR